MNQKNIEAVYQQMLANESLEEKLRMRELLAAMETLDTNYYDDIKPKKKKKDSTAVPSLADFIDEDWDTEYNPNTAVSLGTFGGNGPAIDEPEQTTEERIKQLLLANAKSQGGTNSLWEEYLDKQWDERV